MVDYASDCECENMEPNWCGIWWFQWSMSSSASLVSANGNAISLKFENIKESNELSWVGMFIIDARIVSTVCNVFLNICRIMGSMSLEFVAQFQEKVPFGLCRVYACMPCECFEITNSPMRWGSSKVNWLSVGFVWIVLYRLMKSLFKMRNMWLNEMHFFCRSLVLFAFDFFYLVIKWTSEVISNRSFNTIHTKSTRCLNTFLSTFWKNIFYSVFLFVYGHNAWATCSKYYIPINCIFVVINAEKCIFIFMEFIWSNATFPALKDRNRSGFICTFQRRAFRDHLLWGDWRWRYVCQNYRPEWSTDTRVDWWNKRRRGICRHSASIIINEIFRRMVQKLSSRM